MRAPPLRLSTGCWDEKGLKSESLWKASRAREWLLKGSGLQGSDDSGQIVQTGWPYSPALKQLELCLAWLGFELRFVCVCVCGAVWGSVGL